LVREQTELARRPVPRSVAEFFVLRNYRGKGVGRAGALRTFSSFPAGPWVVGQTPQNLPAQRFWRRVIAEATGGAVREREDGHRHLM
jgi:predicted acetyltransferase